MKPQIFWLMATICSFAVANLYYNQPILAEISQSFDASPSQVGWIPTLTQMGYASGLLLFVPLGDCWERRRLIICMLLITSFLLIIAALSPNLNILILANYGMGATTIVAQIILPFSTEITPKNHQGKIIGNLMSALFLGILLARPMAGWLAAKFSWQSIYWLAGIIMFVLAIASAIILPKSQSKLQINYSQLLLSLWQLTKSQPILREASLIQAMLFGAFSVFWSTLSFLLAKPPYSFNSSEVGMFGLVGIVSIFAAPILGRIADKGNEKTLSLIVGMTITLAIISYLIFWQLSNQIWGLIMGSILLNLASQGSLVANQVKVYGLDSATRSRLNTVFMVATFIGASLGSILGSYGWDFYRWNGACLAGLLLIFVAAIRFVVPNFKQTY